MKWLIYMSFEPRHEKTDILHMRKQRRRTASRCCGLVVQCRTPELEVGGSILTQVAISLSKIHLPPKKVLAIPRKWLLQPDMSEKLLTGT